MHACFQRWENPLPHSTLIFRSEALAAVDGYDELFRMTEDHDLHLRLMARFSAGCIPEALVQYRIRENSKQFSDPSGDHLKYLIFAHARQTAVERYGPLDRAKQLALLSGVDAWVHAANLGKRWKACVMGHWAVARFRQGRLWQSAVQLSRSIAQDPRFLLNRIVFRQRHILDAAEHKELDAVIDKTLAGVHSH